MNDHLNNLELTGEPLRRYLEIRRLRLMIDGVGEKPVTPTGGLEAISERTRRVKCVFDHDYTPERLEEYAQKKLGKLADGWMTRGHWEMVILYCYEKLSDAEAAKRRHLTEEDIRRRWSRTKRYISHFSGLKTIIDTERRELHVDF